MRHIRFSLTMLALLCFASGIFAQVSTPGNVKSITRNGSELLLKTDNAEARVWVYSPTIIRVNVSRKFNTAADTSFAVVHKAGAQDINYIDSKTAVIVKTRSLKLVINKSPLRFNFYKADGSPLTEDAPDTVTTWHGSTFKNYHKIYNDERFIGLGEKTGNLDRRGQSFVNWNVDDGGYGPNSDPLYESYPFFMAMHHNSTLFYGVFLDNTYKSYFDFGKANKAQSSFGADGGDLNYYFFGAQSVTGILTDYTWLTGRMPMPPLWSLGYQQCRWSYKTQEEVLSVAQKFRDLQIPADVIYCDIDYMDHYKVFTWNPTTFPDPKKLTTNLNKINFHLVTIVDPGIGVQPGYKIYDEGIAHHYFGEHPDGKPYVGGAWPGDIHFPAFNDEQVRKWWGISALAGKGVEGFWNDMNEPSEFGRGKIPDDVHFGNRSAAEVHNAYGMQMARGTFEGTKKLMNGKRPFVLTRSAYSGTQRYSAVWTGDNTPYDEHMLLGQRLINTLGLAGMAFAGDDIGGFSEHGHITPELHLRWNSLGVYSPLYRNHSSLLTQRREPWVWGEANEKIIKKDIEQRYRLMPYIYSTFYKTHTTGIPVDRSLAINYPQEPSIYSDKYDNEFLFGDNILVAPAISTITTADIYLPAGRWYRLSSDSLYNGHQNYTVSAPLTDLPAFVKAGAIIPQQHVVQSTSDKGDGILELHIYNGSTGSTFVYYEDDGITYNYEKGAYLKRNITFDPVKKTIFLGRAEGTFASRYTKIKLVMHGFNPVNEVRVNGKKHRDLLFNNSRDALNITY